jgi:branched-chain amino acid transport system ATP-binding protein
MLQLTDVGVFRGADRPLTGVSLELSAGELVVLIGPNGGGKSTTLKTIAGYLEAARGRIEIDGRDVTGGTDADRRRDGIALVPEDPQLVPGLTPRQHLALACPADAREALSTLVPEAASLPDRPAAQLGRASRWWLQLAVVLGRPVQWLAVDEPGAGLAVAEVRTMIARLRSLATVDRGVIVASGSARLALEASDRAYVLENGRVTLSGRSAELRGLPRVRDTWMAA